jgi:hypothetical protein
VQIADLCAQIVARYLNDSGADEAFELLLKKIVLQDGAAIRMIHFDPAQSLWNDSVENHVRIRDH